MRNASWRTILDRSFTSYLSRGTLTSRREIADTFISTQRRRAAQV
jgi:hypothetical protein